MKYYRYVTLAHIALFAYFIYFGVTIFTLGLDTVSHIIILVVEVFLEFINWGQYENYKDYLQDKYVCHDDMDRATARYLAANTVCAVIALVLLTFIIPLYLGPLYIILMYIIMLLGTIKSLRLAKGIPVGDDLSDPKSDQSQPSCAANSVAARKITFSFSTNDPNMRFNMTVTNTASYEVANCIIGNCPAYILVEPGSHTITVFGEHGNVIFNKSIVFQSNSNLTITKGLPGHKCKFVKLLQPY